MSADQYAIEVYDHTTVLGRDWEPPPLTDPGDDKAWAAWRGGEEFAAMIEWRSDAISSVDLFPAEQAAGGEDRPVDDAEAAALLEQIRPLVPNMLVQLDITGRVLAAYWHEQTDTGATRQGRPRLWAGKPSLASVSRKRSNTATDARGTLWHLQIGRAEYVDIDTATRPGAARARPAGRRGRPDPSRPGIVVMAWRPDPERPWNARSQTKDAAVLIEAFQSLSKSVVATANNRAAMRPAIVTTRRAQGTMYDPKGDMTGNRQPIREFMRQLQARLKKPADPSAAVGVHIEVDNIAEDITTLDLGGDFDARVSVLRPLMVEAFARSAPAPPQVVLGTEDSNHWSADNAYRQARQVYLASDARFIARIAAALVSSVLGREIHVGWRFEGLDTEAWRSGLASELGLDTDTTPSEHELRAVLWTRAMADNMDYAIAGRYIDTIIATWRGQTPPPSPASNAGIPDTTETDETPEPEEPSPGPSSQARAIARARTGR